MFSDKQFGDDTTQAFLKLLTRSQNIIFSYILVHVPNKTNAEDIYQETVTVLWEKFGQYEPNTRFSVWACVIARYKILEYKRNTRRPNFEFSAPAMNLIDVTAQQTHDLYEDRMEALKQCIKKLPPQHLRLIKMKYENGWSVTQIAEAVQQSAQSIYKQLNKSHMVLMNCIGKIVRL